MYFVASNGIKTSVILPDIDPFNPRDSDYQDNLTKMICWHPRYNLGDKHNFKDGKDFALSLARTCVDLSDICKYIEQNSNATLRLTEIANDGPGDPYYRIEEKGWGQSSDSWYDTGWTVSKDFTCIELDSEDLEDLLDRCNTYMLLDLVNEKNEYAILPLYLYDHSGLAMSTGSFIGRALHADWDSGPVGFIYMDKDTAMENLAGIGDEVYLAKGIVNGTPTTLRNPNSQVTRTAEELLTIHDYLPVSLEQLHVPKSLGQNDPLAMFLDADKLNGMQFYKKNHRLYAIEKEGVDGTVTLMPIASYNPNLVKLTAETWKARAEEVLRGDVCEYDNYLRGEVYGFQNYEGLNEVDACWGFNPGPEDIQSVMAAELSGWYGGEMHYETRCGTDFSIEDFFDEHDFPELREKIRSDVLSFLSSAEHMLPVQPFQMSIADIRANQDNVLDQVVESLYEAHEMPSREDILETLHDHAGTSRAVKPKITNVDLNPDRDYTAEEVMELLNKQPSVMDLIKDAEARMKVPQNKEAKEPER